MMGENDKMIMMIMIMPRESLVGDIRRPVIEGGVENSGMTPRPGSVTSRLLAILQSDKTKRPGSILQAVPGDVSASNITKDTTDVDTTKDTVGKLDTSKDTVASNDTTKELEERLERLVLGRGRGLDLKHLQPLRRPSGLGSFVKN